MAIPTIIENSDTVTTVEFLDISKGLKAMAALVFYGSGSELLYAESFKLGNGTGVGRPVKQETIRALVKNFKFKSEFEKPFYCDGIIPENIMQFNDSVLMWYSEPKMVTLKHTNDKVRKLGDLPTPYLLFRYENGTLRVWATKRKPKKGTKLYHAPFWNVNNSGGVCMGTANISFSVIGKEVTTATFDIESKFFGSKFTHHHNCYKDIYKNIYKGLKGKESFDLNLLKPTNISL